jgi:hypothetical protein
MTGNLGRRGGGKLKKIRLGAKGKIITVDEKQQETQAKKLTFLISIFSIIPC